MQLLANDDDRALVIVRDMRIDVCASWIYQSKAAQKKVSCARRHFLPHPSKASQQVSGETMKANPPVIFPFAMKSLASFSIGALLVEDAIEVSVNGLLFPV
jgi:hypothetical protein